jgi:hypothetical protein
VAVFLLPVTLFAQDGPEIQVSDGKVTMSAQGIPLSRLLSLWDRAVGMNSQVLKPELANRMVSVRFANLPIKEAVHKIFEGQPLNYLLIEGKGIRVTDAATGGTTSTGTTSVSSAFDSPQQQVINTPLNIGTVSPVVNPAGGAQPPQQQTNPFGNQPPSPVPAANTNTNPGGATVPGQLPPALGAANPLIGPTPSATPAQTGGTATPAGFPTTPAPAPAQPQGPGTLGATPGVIR